MRLLIVSPYFAPSSLVGAQRMTSLAKYLHDLGHEIHVIHLTADTMQRTTGNSCHSTAPEGLILHPFDLPEELPNIFANELNIPCCTIEKEYALGAVGQLRTRFQAFIEALEIKNIHGGK